MQVTYHNLTDDALLVFVKDDNIEAFTTIYNRYWERLLIFVIRAIKEQSDAEDIVQEIFISLWNRRKVIAIKTSFSTYIFNCARYMSIRYIEKNINRGHYLEYLADFMLSMQDGAAPENVLNLKETGHQLESAIAQLPGRMQHVFRLSREYNLSYQEIANQLDISEETVRKQIHRALKLLRVQLRHISITILVIIAQISIQNFF